MRADAFDDLVNSKAVINWAGMKIRPKNRLDIERDNAYKMAFGG